MLQSALDTGADQIRSDISRVISVPGKVPISSSRMPKSRGLLTNLTAPAGGQADAA